MNDFLSTIQSRSTIRKFSENPVTKEELLSILEAVRCTQSWNNTQCWEIIVISDLQIRKKLQQTVPSTNPAYTSIAKAPVLIAMCAKTNLSGFFGDEAGSVHGDWYMHDLGLATQNLCNQAHSMGLGTVVVGWMDHEKAQEIIELPDGYKLVSMIPLGHPGQKGKSPDKKEISEFVHYNKFG